MHDASAKKHFIPPRHLIAMARFLELATPSPEFLIYAKHLSLDMAAIEAKASVISVCLATFFEGNDGETIFEFAADGVPAVVVGAHAYKSEKPNEFVCDLVAWPINEPWRFATMLRECEVLGVWDAIYGNRPLFVHRTPEDWLAAGCKGIVPIRSKYTGHWLSKLKGPLVAADIDHGRELYEALRPFQKQHLVSVPAATVHSERLAA